MLESCLDCRELVLESLPRCCAHRSETPAVVQFQRVAVAERDTGSRFEIFRLRPSLRIDRCPVTCLHFEVGSIRFEPGGLIFGHEFLDDRFIRHLARHQVVLPAALGPSTAMITS